MSSVDNEELNGQEKSPGLNKRRMNRKGQGRMGGGFFGGPGGMCVCPNCGHPSPHTAGQPCNKNVCPKCGSIMTRGT
jgi:hypothetical protein